MKLFAKKFKTRNLQVMPIAIHLNMARTPVVSQKQIKKTYQKFMHSTVSHSSVESKSSFGSKEVELGISPSV